MSKDAEDYDIVSDLAEGEDGAPAAPAAQEPIAEPQAKEPDTSTSLRDQISSALKGEPVTPEAASEGAANRDEKGRFAPKADDEPNMAEAGAQPLTQVPRGLDISPEVYATLPEETQASLARTMEYVNQQVNTLNSYQGIEQIIAPRREYWRMNGVTEAQAVGQLFALSDFATRDPSGFVRYFAENNQVDLEELVFGGGSDEDFADPDVAALKSQVAELTNRLETRSVQEQQAAHRSLVDTALRLFDEKDESGRLLRPYVEELGSDYQNFVQMVKSQNPNAPVQAILQDAYDRACWANPTVRAKLQKDANDAAEAERLRANTERVNAARKAGSSVQSGTPTSPGMTPEGGGTLRDTIREAMAAASQ